MIDYNEFLSIPPYSLVRDEKHLTLSQRLLELSIYHYTNCEYYTNIVDALSFDLTKIKSYYDLPFLPVGLFKETELKSISEDNIFKVLTSSGTSGQKVSKIFLDRETAANQQKTLVKIVSNYIGKDRLPMLIVDYPSVLKNRESLSARGAGILGFSIFASERKYALDDDMQIDWGGVHEFLHKHKNKTILVFGFTYMIWKHFYQAIVESDQTLDLSNAILIHGGGWKKLIEESVEPDVFKSCLKKITGIEKIHDYYGMAEQTGCIYMECECGNLHASIHSDVIVRRAKDFSICDFGEKGILQVVSMLPQSYPGHSILTEDEGVILGEDDCQCGRKGKYFKVLGRLKNAEVRGCSDTYEVRKN